MKEILSALRFGRSMVLALVQGLKHPLYKPEAGC